MSNLDAIKALGMISRTAKRVSEGKKPLIAMCPRCVTEPLVFTFECAGFEFTCLGCNGWFGFLDPRPAEPTPELVALADERKARYARERAAREKPADG